MRFGGRRRRPRQRGADTAPVPTVTGASPDAYADAGGETVTITGTGFRSPAQQIPVDYVTFGTKRGTSLTVSSDTELTVVTPANPGSTVYVTSPGGTASYAPEFPALQTELGAALLAETGSDAIRTE